MNKRADNGKGSKRRPEDLKQFQSNWDKVFKDKPAKKTKVPQKQF